MAQWMLDEACMSVGRRIEKNLHEGKDAFAGFVDSSKTTSARGYRSVKGRVSKKVKIKPDGTW